MSYFKALTDVMRDNKLWSQTKALYTYYLVRADFKSGLSYPNKPYTITAYKVYGVGNDATDNKDVSDATDVKETSKKVKASNK